MQIRHQVINTVYPERLAFNTPNTTRTQNKSNSARNTIVIRQRKIIRKSNTLFQLITIGLSISLASGLLFHKPLQNKLQIGFSTQKSRFRLPKLTVKKTGVGVLFLLAFIADISQGEDKSYIQFWFNKAKQLKFNAKKNDSENDEVENKEAGEIESEPPRREGSSAFQQQHSQNLNSVNSQNRTYDKWVLVGKYTPYKLASEKESKQLTLSAIQEIVTTLRDKESEEAHTLHREEKVKVDNVITYRRFQANDSPSMENAEFLKGWGVYQSLIQEYEWWRRNSLISFQAELRRRERQNLVLQPRRTKLSAPIKPHIQQPGAGNYRSSPPYSSNKITPPPYQDPNKSPRSR